MLVEGGLTLLQSFLRQNMVDQLTIYVRTRSAETAQAVLTDQFPDVPSAMMQTASFGQGTLMTYLPHHHYQTKTQATRAVSSALGTV